MERGFRRLFHFAAPLAGLAWGALLISGCSSNLGDAVRPNEKTAAEALGEGANAEMCEADYAKPLIIDISAEDRGDLEAKLKGGGPVVRFDCKTMKVLPTCRLKNTSYQWVGYTPKAQLVELESGDDLGAALPLSGMSFKAALERSGRLNLATMTIGQRSAGMLFVDRDRLEGNCDAATHVVNSVWVGAFKLETGSKGEVMVAADVFGASAHAGSRSERKSMTADGDVDACEKATEDAKTPPAGCTAFVRLELLKIPPPGAAPPEPSEAGETAPKEQKVSCPPGREYNGAFCAAKNSTTTCSHSNVEPCKAKCEKGDGPACRTLAFRASRDKDVAAEKRFNERACQLGEEQACVSRAWIAKREKDDKVAINYFLSGCIKGATSGCSGAASHYRSQKNLTSAFIYTKRGCDLGDSFACIGQARAYLSGSGVKANPEKGVSLLEGDCAAGKAYSCSALGQEYKSGRNLAKDGAKAALWFDKSCSRKSAMGCWDAANLAEAEGSAAVARKYQEKACDLRFRVACDKIGRKLPDPPPRPKGPPPPPPKK